MASVDPFSVLLLYICVVFFLTIIDIQDYVNIQGLKIWQEEFSRIVNYYVEQECNSFLKKKTFDWQSSYQSTTIPIPQFNNYDSESVNMIGRLARELLQQTHCRKTMYLDQMSAWYDPASGRELVGIKTFALLMRSVGVFGITGTTTIARRTQLTITGLDKLLCFMTVKDLQSFVAQTRSLVEKSLKPVLAEFEADLHPTSIIPTNTQKTYSTAISKTKSLWPIFLETVTKIGQMQLLRRQISNLLNVSIFLFVFQIDTQAVFVQVGFEQFVLCFGQPKQVLDLGYSVALPKPRHEALPK